MAGIHQQWSVAQWRYPSMVRHNPAGPQARRAHNADLRANAAHPDICEANQPIPGHITTVRQDSSHGDVRNGHQGRNPVLRCRHPHGPLASGRPAAGSVDHAGPAHLCVFDGRSSAARRPYQDRRRLGDQDGDRPRRLAWRNLQAGHQAGAGHGWRVLLADPWSRLGAAIRIPGCTRERRGFVDHLGPYHQPHPRGLATHNRGPIAQMGWCPSA